jgi:hypothetical protein
MKVAIKLNDTTRVVWRFSWHRTKWKLIGYERQTKAPTGKAWITVSKWCPFRKNWDGVELLEKPTKLPDIVVNELREQARKAPVEL